MSDEQAAAFLARLLEIQGELGLNNARFAREIGATPSHISHLRAGRKGQRISLAFALRAARRFPELRAFFLGDDLPIITTPEIMRTVEEDTTP